MLSDAPTTGIVVHFHVPYDLPSIQYSTANLLASATGTRAYKPNGASCGGLPSSKGKLPSIVGDVSSGRWNLMQDSIFARSHGIDFIAR